MKKCISKQRKYWIFLLSLLILGLFPIFTLVYSYYRDYTSAREIFITKQTEALEHYEGMINREINNIFSDLEFLYKAPVFQDYLSGDTERETLEQSWLIFSRARSIYDQIRYLDAEGLEKIRINYYDGRPEIIGQEALQNKSDRYYFSMLTDFEKPTILLSKFDLNIEGKEIEVPYKPMLRISLPIYAKDGRFNGAIILNYLGANLLDQLQTSFVDNENKVFTLNADGYILLGPAQEDRWGFMFDEGRNKTFKKLYEADWQRLENAEGEIFQSEVGLYLNRKINNGNFIQENSERAAFSGYDLFSIDQFLRVIILGEQKTNPILGEKTLNSILNSKWQLLLVLGIIAVAVSIAISEIYIKKSIAERMKEQYKTAMKEVIKALEATTSLEDDDTGNHIKRVCYYSGALARGLNLPSDQVELISDMASLHDIGKVGIHDSILKKRGSLTDEEREEMKRHVEIGYEVIVKIKMNDIAANIIRFHHENWDNSGYNSGLKKEEIPIEARIVALADVYDALRSKRSYKPAFSHEQAKTIILEDRGKKFDPGIVDIFLACEQEFISISETYCDEDLQKMEIC